MLRSWREWGQHGWWTPFLILALFIQVAAHVYDGFLHTTPVNSFLFMNVGLSDQLANTIESVLLIFVAVLPLVFLLTRWTPSLLVLTAWFTIIPICIFLNHSSFGYEIAFLAGLARISLPLGVYFLLNSKKEQAELVFKIGIAGAFVGHGIEALSLHPKFLDFILDFSETYLSYELAQNHAETILWAIGIIDIIVAVAALVTTFRLPLLYMAFWGLLTAIARITYFEEAGLLPFFLRVSHWLLPLYLAFTVKNTFNFIKIKRDSHEIENCEA